MVLLNEPGHFGLKKMIDAAKRKRKRQRRVRAELGQCRRGSHRQPENRCHHPGGAAAAGAGPWPRLQAPAPARSPPPSVQPAVPAVRARLARGWRAGGRRPMSRTGAHAAATADAMSRRRLLRQDPHARRFRQGQRQSGAAQGAGRLAGAGDGPDERRRPLEAELRRRRAAALRLYRSARGHAIAGHIVASSDQSSRRYPFLMMSTMEVPEPAAFVPNCAAGAQPPVEPPRVAEHQPCLPPPMPPPRCRARPAM